MLQTTTFLYNINYSQFFYVDALSRQDSRPAWPQEAWGWTVWSALYGALGMVVVEWAGPLCGANLYGALCMVRACMEPSPSLLRDTHWLKHYLPHPSDAGANKYSMYGPFVCHQWKLHKILFLRKEKKLIQILIARHEIPIYFFAEITS